MRTRLLTFILSAFFCAALAASVHGVPATPSPAEPSESWDGSVFRIKDARTRVSIASVQLSVSDLKPIDGNLVGEYTIHVPLMQSKNDKGKIILPLDQTMQEIGDHGGTLRGQAISYNKGRTPNRIVCKILPEKGQKILLDITTDDRILQFKSNYLIVEASAGS